MSAPHWLDGMKLQNETEVDFEIVPEEPQCDECGDTGITYEDDILDGQVIGVGTLSKPCICQK